MSLLINALKKFRHESSPSLPLENSGIKQVAKLGKVAKLVLISSSAVTLIAVTAVASVLIFKHMEKARIAKAMQGKTGQMQKMQELMAGSQSGNVTAPSAEGQADLRAQLQQKMQGGAAGNTSPTLSQPPSRSGGQGSAATASTHSANATSAAGQPNTGGLQAKLAARGGGGGSGGMRQRGGGGAQSNQSSSAADRSSANSRSEDTSSDTASSADLSADDSSSDTESSDSSADDTSSDTESSDSSADDTSSDTESSSDSSTDDTSSDAESSSDSSANNTSPDTESVKEASSAQSGKVNIQKVSSQIGANNPTYQQALNFTQLTQYDKAIPLLVNNDKLIVETQGLSALLLAKIYIMTTQYDLANDVLERSVQLNAGSSVEVAALRAQAMFMQQQYQQAVNLLAAQSPELSSFPGYYALLAAAYMRLDQPGNAVSIFQQIVAKFPTSADYWLGLAVAYQKSGDVNSALIAYRRAAQLNENDPQVLLFINQQLQVLQVA